MGQDQDGWETCCLPQEHLAQGASAGHVLHHQGPPCNSAFSLHTKYAAMITQVTPYNYSVSAQDDGNMPSVT